MSGRDVKKTDEEGNSKRKSDTAQSCWKLKKREEKKTGFNSCAVLQMQ